MIIPRASDFRVRISSVCYLRSVSDIFFACCIADTSSCVDCLLSGCGSGVGVGTFCSSSRTFRTASSIPAFAFASFACLSDILSDDACSLATRSGVSLDRVFRRLLRHNAFAARHKTFPTPYPTNPPAMPPTQGATVPATVPAIVPIPDPIFDGRAVYAL